MFPRLSTPATFVADTNFVSGTQKMFLILFRNILCPQQMFPSLHSIETQHSFCVPRSCKSIGHRKKSIPLTDYPSFTIYTPTTLDKTYSIYTFTKMSIFHDLTSLTQMGNPKGESQCNGIRSHNQGSCLHVLCLFRSICFWSVQQTVLQKQGMLISLLPRLWTV